MLIFFLVSFELQKIEAGIFDSKTPAAYEASGNIEMAVLTSNSMEKEYFLKLKIFRESSSRYEDENMVLYSSGSNRFLIKRIINEFGGIRNSLKGFKLLNKTTIEIYPYIELFSYFSRLGENAKKGIVGICKFHRIMLLTPAALPFGYRYLDTLSHELIHLIINEITLTKAPLWIQEGVAKYFEASYRNFYELKPNEVENLRTLKNSPIPLKKMEPSLVYLDQDEIPLAFSQLKFYIKTIIDDFGEGKLFELLRNIKSYDRDEAFRKTFGMSERKLEKILIKKLKETEFEKVEGVFKSQIIMKKEEELIGADAMQLIINGDEFRKRKFFSAALNQYEKAYRLEPVPFVLVKIARCYIEMSDYEKAHRIALEITAKNPDYPTGWEVLGDVLYTMNKIDDAIEAYKNVIDINPFNTSVLDKIVKLYKLKGVEVPEFLIE